MVDDTETLPCAARGLAAGLEPVDDATESTAWRSSSSIPGWRGSPPRPADPTARPEVRGLHLAICDAGIAELRALLERGVRSGAIARDVDLDAAARLVSAVIGPGLTDVVLGELGASLHEVLSSAALRRRLDARRRRRLARAAVRLLRVGLGAAPSRRKRGLR